MHSVYTHRIDHNLNQRLCCYVIKVFSFSKRQWMTSMFIYMSSVVFACHVCTVDRL